MSTKRTPAENAERRLRAWVKGEHRDSDVAADIRTLLGELDVVRARLADEREITALAQVVVDTYNSSTIYAIEAKDSSFVNVLGELCDRLTDPDCRTIGPF